LRVEFVNRISDYVENASDKAKGAYSEDINAELSMMYISLKNGDHTTFIHEMIHRYIRNYWNTEPV
jgi:hypothetical protein